MRKLGRPYCDTGQAYPREGCAPSLARNCPRFARVPQFAPRAGAAVIPPNEREARGGVSASAPVIAYVINARTGQETPTAPCLIREIGGRSAGNADEVALCRHPPGQCQGKTV